MRQIFLDTETTGFEFKEGHRVIEFGAVEMIDRKLTGNDLHLYFKPDIAVDAGAFKVHGISNEFLADKPLFQEQADKIMNYIKGAEVIIHNAAFDIPFLNSELRRIDNNHWGDISQHISVVDSLILAREKHPGQRNSLDALCKRYGINNKHRVFHGALLDSQILADVYLAMTGGQISLKLEEEQVDKEGAGTVMVENKEWIHLPIVCANELSLSEHRKYLKFLEKKSGKKISW
jgi:DNA polymerase III subunit epsilon